VLPSVEAIRWSLTPARWSFIPAGFISGVLRVAKPDLKRCVCCREEFPKPVRASPSKFADRSRHAERPQDSLQKTARSHHFLLLMQRILSFPASFVDTGRSFVRLRTALFRWNSPCEIESAINLTLDYYG
jgi:hypothetical protein